MLRVLSPFCSDMPNRYFVPIAQHLLGELFDSEAFCKGNRMRSLQQPSSTKSNLSNHHTSRNVEEDTKLLKQGRRKLEDQHRRQEKIIHSHRSIRQANSIFVGTISSTNNSIDIYDQRMGHSPVLSKPRQYREYADMYRGISGDNTNIIRVDSVGSYRSNYCIPRRRHSSSDPIFITGQEAQWGRSQRTNISQIHSQPLRNSAAEVIPITLMTVRIIHGNGCRGTGRL